MPWLFTLFLSVHIGAGAVALASFWGAVLTQKGGPAHRRWGFIFSAAIYTAAAQAFGMSRFQVMLRIVLPSAMRRTLPAYSNEVVMMLQSTSLASAVPSMLDVTAAASRVYSDYYLPFEAYLAAAAIYLMASFCLIAIFRVAEWYFLAYLAPRKH